DRQASAKIIAKESTIVAGVEVARAVFLRVDPTLKVDLKVKNGDAVGKGDVLLTIEGAARSILKAERVALNFFARMCGIAALTREFVKRLEGTKAQLLD